MLGVSSTGATPSKYLCSNGSNEYMMNLSWSPIGWVGELVALGHNGDVDHVFENDMSWLALLSIKFG